MKMNRETVELMCAGVLAFFALAASPFVAQETAYRAQLDEAFGRAAPSEAHVGEDVTLNVRGVEWRGRVKEGTLAYPPSGRCVYAQMKAVSGQENLPSMIRLEGGETTVFKNLPPFIVLNQGKFSCNSVGG